MPLGVGLENHTGDEATLSLWMDRPPTTNLTTEIDWQGKELQIPDR
jgi:hypothetical protein